MNTKESIRSRALSLGFDACGFAAAHSHPRTSFLDEWLAASRHGDMKWMEGRTGLRKDPSLLLENAASLVLVGVNYFQPDPRRRGIIAKYALGLDYHDWIDRRLSDLGEWIAASSGARWRKFVDTSPVMEKPAAEAAGMGWQAKNTMLVSRTFGNWLALGGIATDLAVDPDPPGRDSCGSCTRCITACPTAAITAPYQLDARRCIAFLTIEHKGSIPCEFRPAIGNRLFGCDICLDICPWNRWAAASRHSHFAARPMPDLREMLAWTDQQFRTHFRGTPIFRLKRSRWFRNICVVLGNTGGTDDLPALEACAADTDPLVSEHACWAIDRIQSRRSECPAP